MQKRTWICLVVTAVVACMFRGAFGDGEPSAPSGGKSPATQPTRAADPKMAYALGLGLGQRLRERLKTDGLTVDAQVIIRGLIDGLQEYPPLYPDDEMRAAIARIEQTLRREQAERMMAADPGFRKLAEANLERSQKYMKELSALEGFEALPNGVLVKVRKPGDGPVIANARHVQVLVEVSLADGTFVHKTPADKPARMSTLQMLPAVLEAVRGMHTGGHWQIAVPAEHAYGLAGRPPLFGPNQALLLDVQLVAVEP